MQNDKEPPIVVIGGGSTGSSTAYHLAKMGQKVLLIDKGQIASGMTSRSTALVRTHYSNEIVARMALYSLRAFESFGEIGFCGFVNNGMLFLGSEGDREGIAANLSMLHSIGVKCDSFTREAASRRFPEVNFEGADIILHEPESGYADPVAAANSYASKARELGAVLLLGEEVKKLHSSSGKLVSLELSGGKEIRCSRAILCTNVWTNELLSRSGAKDKLPLWSVAHPVIVLRRPNTYLGIRASIADFIAMTYYKPEGQSLFFGGSLDPALDHQEIDPNQCPTEVPFEFMNFYSEAITKRIPLMTQGVLHSSYVGMYDMTPDQHPIMDELGSLGFEGLYCCVGLSGHGFKLCPALGLMNAELLLGESGGLFDRLVFSLERFQSGKLLKSKYSTLGTVA